ncbi:MAG TPA: hypothetical protein VFR03_02355 [Thermoanaerobaculia bacterium]|nr:hypothetical protein [Thermoanaerobaculia bacterium]
MPRKPPIQLFALLMSLLLTACAAYQAQHTPPRAVQAGPEDVSATLEAIAPSGDFTALGDGPQVSRIKGEVEQAKASLARKGQYSCCVRPACSQCLLKYGHCRCREAVKKDGPCCGECTEAWIEGRGAVEGVTAWDILEKKRKILEEANKKP